MREERPPHTGASVLWGDIQVLEPDAGEAQPCRERAKPERETDGLTVQLRDHRLGHRIVSEQRRGQERRRPHDPPRGPIILGQLDDQGEDQLNVGVLRRPDANRAVQLVMVSCR